MMKAYLGLGSNLGDRVFYLRGAIMALTSAKVDVTAVSRIYETEPWGVKEQPEYLNQVVEVETSLEPLELLHVCQKIEQQFGRERKEHWGSRTIDIDLLIYDNRESDSKELTLPHPYLEKREFVLAPLREIAPTLILPSGNAISEVTGEGKVHPLEF
jgi:2-amino-4-hydroxy-6-hydroxymethyldihydropteridine diphosphokinase